MSRYPICIYLHLYTAAAAGGPLAAVPAYAGLEVAAAQYLPGGTVAAAAFNVPDTNGGPAASSPSSASQAAIAGGVVAACVVLAAVGVAVRLSHAGRQPRLSTNTDRGVTAIAPSTGNSTAVERTDAVGTLKSPRRRLTATVIPVGHIRKSTPWP